MTSESWVPRAFISYSRQDGGFVSELHSELAAAKFDVWRDVDSLRAGDRWPRRLGDAIAASPTFILIWSNGAAASEFVELEWTIAVALRRTICIVALDESALPPTLRPYQSERTVVAQQAARWLLHQASGAEDPSAAVVVPLLDMLSGTPDTKTAKQIAERLIPAPSNIPSRGRLPFVGREDSMARIDELLANMHQECVVVLQGASGVGKSELAREYARLRRERYAGGTFAIDASSNAYALEFAALGERILDLTFPTDMKLDDRGVRTFSAVTRHPVLLVYDNVVSFEHARSWFPYSGMPCHVLITTLIDKPTTMWPCLEVDPLTTAQSVELIEKISEGELDKATTQSIATDAGGLPVQILPHAAALASGRRRHRNKQSRSGIAVEAGNSFRAAYSRLDPKARVLLHDVAYFNTQRIVSEEIGQHLTKALGWTQDEVDDAFDSCLDLHIFQGSDELRMHQLFAEFVRETALSQEERAEVAQVAEVQAVRFLELAAQVWANPADLNAVTRLLDYPLTLATWGAMGRCFSAEEDEIAGNALVRVGRFEEAQPWFERAVEEKQAGHEHGRVNHESLASSLHQVGYCYSGMGRFEEARPWFERAVAEGEEGDVEGRVNHGSLGMSLGYVGYCYDSTGRFEEALPWFERAVEQKQKGDANGRVDHESLGSGLHQVGACYSSAGRFEEARPWFERAVEESEKGDVYGRVDYESVGRSLHQVGVCYSSTGQFEEARLWFERAAAEAEKGDANGHVDHKSLSTSLHQVGVCHSSMGRFEEARPWFERAAAEAEKGDVYGRVDHASLGISLLLVGGCYSRTGRFDEACPWLERAVEETEKGDVHGRVQRELVTAIVRHLVECLRKLDRQDDARQWEQRYGLGAVTDLTE